MIKKDISYGINSETGNDVILSKPEQNTIKSAESSQLSNVDLIFQEADTEMREQKTKYIKQKTKKTRKHRFRFLTRFILPILLILAGIVGYITYSGVQFINNVVPELRVQIADSLINSRRELEQIPDDKLNVDEYYSKRVLLLLSEEEIRTAVNALSGTDVLFNSQNGELGIDDIIPPAKRAEYQAIKAEYEKAKADEALSMIPSRPPQSTDESQESNSTDTTSDTNSDKNTEPITNETQAN
jgi:hypothetical protein